MIKLKTPFKLLAGLLCTFGVAVIALTWYLGSGISLGERHAAFDKALFSREFLNKGTFDYEGEDFQAYINYSRELMLKARVKPVTETELDNLSPFILHPPASCPLTSDGKYQKGVALTHGLVASPYSMRSIAEFFQQECFFVVSLLLPGHGTRPGDMLNSSWEEWVQAQHFATQYVSNHAEQLWLSGHSAGGTLAIYEAATNKQVDGLVLFAPALGITPSSRFAGAVSLLGHLYKPAAWLEVEPDNSVYRYESFPYYAGAQTWELIQATWRALEKNPLSIPAFTVASTEDMTVSTQAIMEFMNNQSAVSHTLLFSQSPQSSQEPDEKVTIVESGLPERNILSLSHLGLMTPPDHPYYGEQGNYHYCEYLYDAALAVFNSCLNGESDYLGETTEENLQKGSLERIAFNPHYETMTELLTEFLKEFLQ